MRAIYLLYGNHLWVFQLVKDHAKSVTFTSANSTSPKSCNKENQKNLLLLLYSKLRLIFPLSLTTALLWKSKNSVRAPLIIGPINSLHNSITMQETMTASTMMEINQWMLYPKDSVEETMPDTTAIREPEISSLSPRIVLCGVI